MFPAVAGRAAPPVDPEAFDPTWRPIVREKPSRFCERVWRTACGLPTLIVRLFEGAPNHGHGLDIVNQGIVVFPETFMRLPRLCRRDRTAKRTQRSLQRRPDPRQDLPKAEGSSRRSWR